MKRFATPFIFLLLLGGTAGCDQAGSGFDSNALEEARAQWESSSPSSYRFDYERGGCYCSPAILSATVYVRADTVWKFENVGGIGTEGEPVIAEEHDITRQRFPTVDEMFERVEEYPGDGKKDQEVEYDGDLGYPTSVAQPGNPDVADSGISYELSNLTSTD